MFVYYAIITQWDFTHKGCVSFVVCYVIFVSPCCFCSFMFSVIESWNNLVSNAFFRSSGSGVHCALLIRLPVPSFCSLWPELPKCHFKVLQPSKAWMGFRSFRSTVMIVQLTDCPLRTHGMKPSSQVENQRFPNIHIFNLNFSFIVIVKAALV